MQQVNKTTNNRTLRIIVGLTAWFAIIVMVWPVGSAQADGPGSVGSGNGLQMWLKADAGIEVTGANVTRWNDQSTGGNSTEATAPPLVNQPQFFANVPGLNNQNVLRFDGSDVLTVPNSASLNPPEIAMFVVGKYQAATTNWAPFVLKGTGDPPTTGYGLIRNDAANQTRFFAADYNTNFVVGGPAVDTYAIMTGVYSGSAVGLFVNGTSQGTDSFTETISTTQPLVIGRNISATRHLDGEIAEIIIYDNPLNIARRTIIENYLSAKYNINPLTNNKYIGDNPANGNYDLEVAGIGVDVDGSNHPTANTAGLIIDNVGGPGQFLQNSGDYLLAGHRLLTNTISTANLPPTVFQRWDRVWYLDKTDIGGNGGNLTLSFDFSEAGMTFDPAIATSDYRLLTSTVPLGTFNEASVGTPTIVGDRVTFSLDANLLNDGYYTLGIVSVPNLQLAKTVSPVGPVVPGEFITYTLRFTNAGLSVATPVTITDPIPNELIPTSLSFVSSGPVVTPSGSYVWQVADLAAGQSGSITVTGRVRLSLGDVSFTNVATMTAGNVITPAIDSATIAVQQPTVSFDSATYSVNEASGPAMITVQLDRLPQADVGVVYSLTNGSASHLTDYVTNTQAFTIPAGSLTASFTIPITDDTLYELDETVNLSLTLNTPARAKLGTPNTAVLTIINDDLPFVTIIEPGGGTSVTEGGATDFYRVRLSGPAASTLVIRATPADSQIDLGAGAGLPIDLTYTPGVVQRNVTVTAVDDTLVEGFHNSSINHAITTSSDPAFPVGTAAFSPTNVVAVSIQDNELGYVVSATPTEITEGNGGVKPITFTVERIGITAPVSIFYTVVNGSATPGDDFDANVMISGVGVSGDNQIISFTTGATMAILNVNVIGDFIDEGDETVALVIETLNFASITILDDDTANVTFSGTAGNTSELGGTATLPIELTSQPASDVTVEISSTDVTEGVASPTTLTFTPANWNIPQNIVVTGQDDPDFDGDITYRIEAVSVTSLDPKYASLNIFGIRPVTLINIDDETATNQPPIANPDNVTTPEDTPRTVTVLTNDSDPDGDPISLVSVGTPSNGSAAIVGSSVVYTPNVGFAGIDSFSYTITDGTLNNSAVVIVTVTAVNNPPVANNDTIATNENKSVTIAILANDTDDSGFDLGSVTITQFPTNGSVLVNTVNGSVTYTPDPNFSGSDSFRYTVEDDDGVVSNQATVFIGVTAVNDGPVVSTPIPDQSTAAGSPFSYLIPANSFTDADGDLLTYSARQANGQPLPTWLSFNPASRTFSGTPTNSDVGTVDIEVTASDGSLSASDTFLLTITPDSNAVPILNSGLPDRTVTVGQGFNFNIAPNFTDPDGDPLTYSHTILDGSTLSWLSFNPNTGTFSGTPPPGTPEIAKVIRVTATDPSGASVSDDFILSVDSSVTTPTATPTPTTTPGLVTPTPTSTPDPNARGSLSGVVRNQSGQPLPNINVLLWRLEGTTWKPYLINQTTDVTGSYQFNNLPVGQYRVQFADASGTYANLYYGNTINFDRATIVEVVTNQTTAGVDIFLPLPQTPQVDVTGKVSVNENSQTGLFEIIGWPGSEMTVYLGVLCDNGASASNVSLIVGAQSFALDRVPNSAEGHNRTIIMPTDFTQLGTSPVELQWVCDGVTRQQDVGSLYYSASRSGRVVRDDTGEPIIGAMVTLYQIPGATRQNCATQNPGAGVIVNPQQTAVAPAINPQLSGADGGYAWTVPAGCWFVIADAAGYQPQRSPVVPQLTNLLDIQLTTGSSSQRSVYLPLVVKR